MTEAEWLTATDPTLMLEFIRGRASSRKLLCFFQEFCPDFTTYTTDGVDEGIGSELDFRPPWLDVSGPDDDTLPTPTRCWLWAKLVTQPYYSDRRSTRPRAVAALLLRELFGNPFRPVTVDPSWLTSTALALATGIYHDKAFEHLPILADALQDAGCSQEDLLTHLRSEGPHVRGCWALDLVLGKS